MLVSDAAITAAVVQHADKANHRQQHCGCGCLFDPPTWVRSACQPSEPVPWALAACLRCRNTYVSVMTMKSYFRVPAQLPRQVRTDLWDTEPLGLTGRNLLTPGKHEKAEESPDRDTFLDTGGLHRHVVMLIREVSLQMDSAPSVFPFSSALHSFVGQLRQG